MGRYKFEKKLMAFLINKQQYCLSIVDGKIRWGGTNLKISLKK